MSSNEKSDKLPNEDTNSKQSTATQDPKNVQVFNYTFCVFRFLLLPSFVTGANYLHTIYATADAGQKVVKI